MSNTIYIVTGAAGHLGSHIVQQLLLQGKHVRAFLLKDESCPEFISQNRHLLTQYVGDVRDPASIDPLFECSTPAEFIVIHCAGIITIAAKPDQRVHDVNVGGTANMIDACKRHNAKRLIYTSSVHAIPLLPHGQSMVEVASFDPDQVIGLYAKTKACATQLVLSAAKDGLDAIVVHPSGIIGPHGLPSGNMTKLISNFLYGKIPAAIKGGYDYVDVRDVANGVLAAIEKGISGECYILSNRFVDLSELFDTLSDVSGQKKLRLYLPLWIAKAIAPFTELYYRLTRKTPLFTRYSLHTLSENGVFSHDKASKQLGYRPRPLKDTLADTVQWWVEKTKQVHCAYRLSKRRSEFKGI